MGSSAHTGDLPEQAQERKQRGGTAWGEDLLRSLYRRQGWTLPWLLYLVHRDWPRIAGPDLAGITTPLLIRRHTLWVGAEHPALCQLARYGQEAMLERLAAPAYGGQIQDIRFQVTSLPVSAPEPAPEPPPARPRPAALRAFAGQTAIIHDPATREALIRLYRLFGDATHGSKPTAT